MLLYLFNTFKRSQGCFCVSSVRDAAGHLALWDTRCLLTTCLHHPVMVNQSNKYELEHLQFPFFSNGVLSIYLFICLAVRTLPAALGLQPWTTGCCAGGLICWEGHVSRRQCSLSFSSSSDTHLDAPVLTAFVYPDQSICRVISSVFSLTTLSPPSPPLRAYTRPFISMRSEDDCLKTLFMVQYIEIHRGCVTWRH